MAGVIYVEVRGDMDEFAVFQEVYGPTGIATQTVNNLARYCLGVAVTTSPIGNAMNYGSQTPPPRIPGQYKALWKIDRRGTNFVSYNVRVSNAAPYADIIELGRNNAYVKQKFTWTKARKVVRVNRETGAYRYVFGGANTGGWVRTNFTRGYPGKHILANAQRAAAARYGLATT